MEFIEDPESRIAKLLATQERRIAAVFMSAVESLKSELDLDELADLLESGRINEALERLQFAAEQLGNASGTTFVTAGQSAEEFLANAGIARVAFNQVNLFAVAAMQANRLELIREFNAEQLAATSAALNSGVASGANPKVQARNFRDSIGLTQKQWQIVAAYRDKLERAGTGEVSPFDVLNYKLRDKRGDAAVLRAVRDSKPLPRERIDSLVERYAKNFVAFRARVIGRSEALRAVHQGNEEMYRQAIEDGRLNADDLERTWNARLDGRERETHMLLNGQKKGWGEPWETVNGPIRYPGDPEAPAREVVQCRCALSTRIRRR